MSRTSPAAPTPITRYLNSLFPRCTTLPLLRQLHAHLLLRGLHLSAFFASRLAAAYFAAASPLHARQVFDHIPHPTPHAWNTLLSGYSHSLPPSHLLPLYRLARASNHRPDSFSLVFALRALTTLSYLEPARSVHAEAVRSGLDAQPHVLSALITMYLESGSIEDAEKAFNSATADSIAYGLMMNGYLRASMGNKVFYLFKRMKEAGLGLDVRGAICLSRVCGSAAAAKEGQAIHALCVKKNYFDSNVYLQTSLVDMYGKSGFIDSAIGLFDEMEGKDVVSWSAVIAALAQSGRAYEALKTFRVMLQEGLAMPNEVTLASALLACSHLGALQQGKSIHAFIVRNEVALDVVTYTALLDMYAKCGSVESSYRVFDAMPERNVFSWSAMIGGFGMHGMCSRALAVFDHMRSENVEPNAVTFVSVLSACSHSGKVEEGRRYFESMSKDYKITPTNEHYSCMVDLLGRIGKIDEAESLIRKMPMEPGASVWGALLGACRIHKKVELAQKVADKLFILEPDHPNTHVLISNIYAAAEMWNMVKKTRELIKKRGLRKIVGLSTIEVDKRVYIFNAINKLNAETTIIMELWRRLRDQMKALGYTPDLSSILCDVGDEEKEEMLCGHSEKLALAFGLLKTKPGMPLRITKNLRVCGDCHTASKFVSLIAKREIIMRDSKRFHHVKDGICSCGDYW